MLVPKAQSPVCVGDRCVGSYPGLNYYIRAETRAGCQAKLYIMFVPESQLQSQWDWGAVLRRSHGWAGEGSWGGRRELLEQDTAFQGRLGKVHVPSQTALFKFLVCESKTQNKQININ